MDDDLVCQVQISVYLREVRQSEFVVGEGHRVHEHQLCRPDGPVEVYRLEHLVPRNQEGLEGVQRSLIQDQVVLHHVE